MGKLFTEFHKLLYGVCYTVTITSIETKLSSQVYHRKEIYIIMHIMLVNHGICQTLHNQQIATTKIARRAIESQRASCA